MIFAGQCGGDYSPGTAAGGGESQQCELLSCLCVKGAMLWSGRRGGGKKRFIGRKYC